MSNPVVPAAPPERAPAEELHAEACLIEAMPGFQKIIDALPVMTAVLNQHRQIVAANARFIHLLEAESAEEVRGLRLGEALQCVNSSLTDGGCGTSEPCGVCGALKALLSSQLGHAGTHLCRMRRRAEHEEPFEVDVWATPLEASGQRFTLVCLSNTSDRERRNWLERGVVPRALAIAGEVEALASSLDRRESASTARDKTLALLSSSARRLASTIRDEIDLSAAEAGALAGTRRLTSATEILRAAAAEFEYDEAATGRAIVIEPEIDRCTLDTDPSLLQRVLSRLIVNALEASPQGATVALGLRNAGSFAELCVRSAGVMPRAVQFQVFQRGFSTKGPGRGFGTYFAHLIAERCLGGTVVFRSSEKEGTEFAVRIPRLQDAEPQQ